MDRSIKHLLLRDRFGCPGARRFRISSFAAFWVAALCLMTAMAVNGQAPAGTASGAISTITSERNVKNDSGELTVIMKRLPGDPRSGETGHVLVSLSETVQGGFGSGPLPVEKAAVVFSITRPDGAVVAGNIAAMEEAGGLYRGSYQFDSSGDYKLVVAIATEDKRTFSADFPVTVSRAPIRTSFWIGLLVLLVLSGVSFAVVFYALKRKGDASFRRLAPAGAVVLTVFLLSSVALAFLLPPSQTRETAAIPSDAFSTSAVNELPKGATITLPKESQLLFGIKTQLIDTRQITSGLKTTGVVRPRPDAKGVVTAQVPGRIVLNQAVALGSAVGRGEQIGYVEQVLDVSGQTELESQRLDVEVQQREVEARNAAVAAGPVTGGGGASENTSSSGSARTSKVAESS